MIGKMNESVTDDIISDFFKGNDFYKEDKVSIERQSSSSIKIDKLLKNASKGGSGNAVFQILSYSEKIFWKVGVVVIEFQKTKWFKGTITKKLDTRFQGF